MTTYFISDLHLSSKRPQATELFLQFLKKEAKEADAIYILGDFFDVWIGDDQINMHDAEVIEALAQYTHTGVPVYFIHGNRDFLLGDRFFSETGCIPLPDPTPIQLYGKTLLLSHGDLLCTADKKYQRFRSFVRHPLVQKWFLKLPISIRLWIARSLRAYSTKEQTQSKKTKPFWDVALGTVYTWLRKHKCETIIHGHTHKPQVHDFLIDGKPAKRFVLGDWGDEGMILAFSDTDAHLIRFS